MSDDIERLDELTGYVKLTTRVMMMQYPLLPWPELPQDVGYLAFVLDGQHDTIEMLTTALADVWRTVSRSDVERLNGVTQRLCESAHNEREEHGR